MRAQAVTSNWITAGRYDLLWYIGPCLLSYLLMYLHLGLAVPVMVLWWTWVVVVDGPHVFGTISRTYLDAEEWRRRRRLLLGALVWFVPGPLCVLLGVISGSKQPYVLFLLFANLWAYWHVVRQHYGFLALYQRKNGEAAGQQNRVDYWVYYTLMLAPLGCFMILNKHAREALMLPSSASRIDFGVLTALQLVVVGALAAYVAKEWTRWRRGEPLNVPKNLFLFAVVPVHLTVCMHPQIAAGLDLLMFSVLVTFHHNIQYHGIVWYYNRNRYRGEQAKERFGRAAWWLNRSFWTYYLAGLTFTFVVRYTSWIFTGMEHIPGGPGPNFISATSLGGGGFTVADLAVGFWWGFALHHYYLDQKIWRVSKDDRLRSDLRVA